MWFLLLAFFLFAAAPAGASDPYRLTLYTDDRTRDAIQCAWMHDSRDDLLALGVLGAIREGPSGVQLRDPSGEILLIGAQAMRLDELQKVVPVSGRVNLIRFDHRTHELLEAYKHFEVLVAPPGFSDEQLLQLKHAFEDRALEDDVAYLLLRARRGAPVGHLLAQLGHLKPHMGLPKTVQRYEIHRRPGNDPDVIRHPWET